MADPSKKPAESVIVFRFSGGALDGHELRSDQACREAHSIWALTWQGTAGRRFDVTAPNTPINQRYQVTSKHDEGKVIYVVCEHVD